MTNLSAVVNSTIAIVTWNKPDGDFENYDVSCNILSTVLFFVNNTLLLKIQLFVWSNVSINGILHLYTVTISSLFNKTKFKVYILYLFNFDNFLVVQFLMYYKE